ncbi:MAG: hypothetical protein PVJ27_01675 [Candidatus Brocadiaceae bacterium]|jgi:broad-specificity NMP kinase
MSEGQKLIFMGGAPGVGKTVTCELLYRSLPDSICLEADDLWCKMNPFRADATTIPMIERNVSAVLRNFLEAGFQHVVLCWVLHEQDIIDRLLDPLHDLRFSFFSFTLVCEEGVLRRRWPRRRRVTGTIEHACHRLRQTRRLEATRLIDTTEMSVEEVVRAIIRQLDAAE